ncbi:MAG TPA: TolC family protein [Candidatus Omnitrophota bacterium]|nr:TolC family protein [Candidatus Omnitrophota bacterium]
MKKIQATLLAPILIFGLSIFLLFSQTAMAEETASVQSTLTEEEAVSNTIRNNYDLRLAKVNVELAKAQLVQAGLWSNPEGEFSIRSDKYYANEGEGGYEYGLNQSIPISGRIFFQRRVARLGIERAEWQLKDVERQVVAEVKKTFYQVTTLQEKEKILSFLVKTNQDLLESVKARLSQAEVSNVDISLARGELLMTSQELAEVKARLYESRANLNRLMGQSLNYPFVIASEPLAFPSIDLETATQKSLEHRPDLKAKELEKEMGSAALTLAKAMQIPDITIGGFYENERSRLDVNDQLISDNDRLIGFKVSMPLPFFDRNQGEIAKSKAEKKGTGIQYEALKIQVAKEVAQAYIRLDASKEIIDSYSNGVREDVEKSVKLMQDAYLQGQVNVFDVVQTQSKFNSIEKAYLDASQNAREAIIDLESAIGASLKNEKMEEGDQIKVLPSAIQVGKPKEGKNL